MRHAPSTSRGFTLVEALVTMGVISLLLALLVPSLSDARRLGKRTLCASQLHSIGTALRLYMDTENRGYLPAAPTYYAEDPDRSVAMRLLAPYLDRPFGAKGEDGRFGRNAPYTCAMDTEFWYRHGYSYDYVAGLWMTSVDTLTVMPSHARRTTFDFESGEAMRSPLFEDLDIRGHTAGMGTVAGQNQLFFDSSVAWKGWRVDQNARAVISRPLDP